MEQQQEMQDINIKEKEERNKRIAKLWKQTIEFQDKRIISLGERMENIELDNLKIHNKINFLDTVVKKEKELRRRDQYRGWLIKIVLTLMVVTLISMGLLPKESVHLLP